MSWIANLSNKCHGFFSTPFPGKLTGDLIVLLNRNRQLPVDENLLECGSYRVDVSGIKVVNRIPDQLPDIVADGLASAGIGWPDVPGIDKVLAPFVELGAVPALDALDEPAAEEEPAP